MMTFPTEWENKIHVPNHQPAKLVNTTPISLWFMILIVVVFMGVLKITNITGVPNIGA